jgi:tetraacyldisaccharide 4'-kinase
MKIIKPKFWDYKKPNIASILLNPFTIPIRINNFFNRIKKKDNKNKYIKTICVGNIYIGGTGKTPSSIKINEILKKLNYKTTFVKKFYAESLDEQLLLENNGNCILANPNRLRALNSAINNNYDVAIFDDGLQDVSIDYHIKFVCFNISSFIGNGLLIPAGPLREKINSLKNYDAVLLNGNNEDTTKIALTIKKQNKDIKIFESVYTLSDLDLLNKKNRYIAFAGIGIPDNFYKTLVNNNFQILDFLRYPDHYEYKEIDLKKINNLAKNLGAKIITTEKDFLRISQNKKFDFEVNIQFVKMQLKIKNEDNLINFIKTKI